jgi:hypothetical protein
MLGRQLGGQAVVFLAFRGLATRLLVAVPTRGYDHLRFIG